MAYFPDLSPYGYAGPKDGALNVGWLSSEHPIFTGDVPEGFLDRLRDLCQNQKVNLCRGSHRCEFCPPRPLHRDPNIDGNGEIRVTRNGITYAAPVLIAHYVEAHRYLPPQDFILAVMENGGGGEI